MVVTDTSSISTLTNMSSSKQVRLAGVGVGGMTKVIDVRIVAGMD